MKPIDFSCTSINQLGEKQKARNHEKQRNATLAEVRVQGGRRDHPVAGMQKKVPDTRVMEEYEKRKVTTWAVYRRESIMGGRRTEPPHQQKGSYDR